MADLNPYLDILEKSPIKWWRPSKIKELFNSSEATPEDYGWKPIGYGRYEKSYRDEFGNVRKSTYIEPVSTKSPLFEGTLNRVKLSRMFPEVDWFGDGRKYPETSLLNTHNLGVDKLLADAEKKAKVKKPTVPEYLWTKKAKLNGGVMKKPKALDPVFHKVTPYNADLDNLWAFLSTKPFNPGVSKPTIIEEATNSKDKKGTHIYEGDGVYKPWNYEWPRMLESVTGGFFGRPAMRSDNNPSITMPGETAKYIKKQTNNWSGASSIIPTVKKSFNDSKNRVKDDFTRLISGIGIGALGGTGIARLLAGNFSYTPQAALLGGSLGGVGMYLFNKYLENENKLHGLTNTKTGQV